MCALTARPWLRLEESVPFTVTAHTPAGFATDTPWTPTIDGILCAAIIHDNKGDDYYIKDDVGNTPWAPLARIFTGGESNTWFFAASSPMYTPLDQYQRKWFRRFDSAECERLVPTANKVSLKTGPYKPFMKSQQVHLAPMIRWLCYGNPAEAERLLTEYIPSIGKRFHAGFGLVSKWEVREGHAGGTVDPRRLRRPVPVDYARQNGIRGKMMRQAIRSPGWMAANQTMCIVPDQIHGDPWFGEGPAAPVLNDSRNRTLLFEDLVDQMFQPVREMPLARGCRL